MSSANYSKGWPSFCCPVSLFFLSSSLLGWLVICFICYIFGPPPPAEIRKTVISAIHKIKSYNEDKNKMMSHIRTELTVIVFTTVTLTYITHLYHGLRLTVGCHLKKNPVFVLVNSKRDGCCLLFVPESFHSVYLQLCHQRLILSVQESDGLAPSVILPSFFWHSTKEHVNFVQQHLYFSLCHVHSLSDLMIF